MYVMVEEGRVSRQLGSQGMRVRGRVLLMFQGDGVDGSINRLDWEVGRRVFGMDMPWDCIRLREVWRRLVGRRIWGLRRSTLPLRWAGTVRMDLGRVIGMVEVLQVLRGDGVVMAILYCCRRL